METKRSTLKETVRDPGHDDIKITWSRGEDDSQWISLDQGTETVAISLERLNELVSALRRVNAFYQVSEPAAVRVGRGNFK